MARDLQTVSRVLGRRILAAIAVLSGCLQNNPAWDSQRGQEGSSVTADIGTTAGTSAPGSTAESHSETGTTENPNPTNCETPTLALDFANSVIDPRFWYFRDAGVATYVSSLGLIETSAIGQPRLVYNPICDDEACAPLGLLVEPTRTNQARTDLSLWSTNESTLVAQEVAAPDGTMSTPQLVDNVQDGEHALWTYAENWFRGETWTFSLFAKADTLDQIGVTNAITPGYTEAHFSLLTGEVVSTDATGELLATGTIPWSGGWWRIWMTFRPVSGDDLDLRIFTVKSGDPTYAGSGDSVSIWGPQLEPGDRPTSYIPTGAAAPQVRGADLAEVTDLDWYNPLEGTFVVEFSRDTPSFGDEWVMQLGDSAGTNFFGVRARSQDTYAAVVRINGEDQGEVTFSLAPGTRRRVVFGYTAGGWAAAFDGSPVVQRSLVDVPSGLTKLSLGDGVPPAKLLGTIRSLHYYPCKHSDNEIRTLSQR